MKLNLSKFHKVSEGKDHSILRHEDGHEMRIVHKGLSKQHAKELKAMPMMAEGGEVAPGGYAMPVSPKPKDKGPYVDPKKAKEMEKGATESGYRPQEWLKNLKESVKMADGGRVDKEVAPGGYAKAPEPKKTPKPDDKDLTPLNDRIGKPFAHGGQIEMHDKPSHGVKHGTMGEIKHKMYAEGEEVAQDDSAPVAELPPVPAAAQQHSLNEIPQMTEAQEPALKVASSPEELMKSEQAPQTVQATTPEASKVEQQATPDMMHAYEQQKQAIQQQSQAEEHLGQAQANVELGRQKKLAEAEQHFNEQVKANLQERKALEKDIQDGHIDPKHYMGDMSTGKRIQTGIALFLGGLGQGLIGGSNPAADFLNNQIDRDINAQKANLGKKENLLSANMREYGNLRDAMDMTRMQLHDMSLSQLSLAAAQAKSPMAKANAMKLQADLEAQMAPIVQQFNVRRSIATAEPGKLSAIDPATVVSTMVPKEHQAKVFGEIQAAQDTKRMGGSIIKAFDQATKENTVMRTGAGMLRTPASVYALHQAMQPTFKDLEGTVRQAAMDNTFKNITPMPGDTEKTVAVKRQALLDYLQSKASAPTAKGFGIDLSKFQSTTPESSPQIKIVNGVKYMRGTNGEAIKVQ